MRSELAATIFDVWCEIYRLTVRGHNTDDLSQVYTDLHALLSPEERAELVARQMAARE